MQNTFPSQYNIYSDHRKLLPFPTRRSSDLRDLSRQGDHGPGTDPAGGVDHDPDLFDPAARFGASLSPSARVDNMRRFIGFRSEEHTSELQSRENLVCRLLLEKRKQNIY